MPQICENCGEEHDEEIVVCKRCGSLLRKTNNGCKDVLNELWEESLGLKEY